MKNSGTVIYQVRPRLLKKKFIDFLKILRLVNKTPNCQNFITRVINFVSGFFKLKMRIEGLLWQHLVR